ncbi:MAG TPA: aldolase/citrate lyase family protein [Falsiroseomonas sp.]|jgi:4-hydroxy-2-oxoheptanedioate aldolase|nr:aldolase/citrate lyase family protein [Falsiroseomonas sp.]
MPRRSFAELLALGRMALGTWSQVPAPELLDILGDVGLDFTIVDCEHGGFDLPQAENLFRACDAAGLVPLCRAPALDPAWIGRALDAGAQAVIVPGLDSAIAAARAVAATRFAPEGTRGACPCVRAGGHFIRDWRAHEAAERDKGVIALVETAEGLNAVEAICATPGLLAVLAGPFDLSVSLGLRGDYRHPSVAQAMDRIAAAARAAALPLIAPVFDPDPAEARRQRREWQARGAALLAIGTDKILFSTAARSYREALYG